MKWKKSEEDILERLHKEHGELYLEDLIHVFPYRSKSSIKNKLYRMDISCPLHKEKCNIDYSFLEKRYGLKFEGELEEV